MSIVEPQNEISQYQTNTHTYCITVEFEPSETNANKAAFRTFTSLGYTARKSKAQRAETSKMYFKNFSKSEQEVVSDIQKDLSTVKQTVKNIFPNVSMHACAAKVLNAINQDLSTFSSLFNENDKEEVIGEPESKPIVIVRDLDGKEILTQPAKKTDEDEIPIEESLSEQMTKVSLDEKK